MKTTAEGKNQNYKKRPAEKGNLHPRNLHQGFYDFEELAAVAPEIKAFFKRSPKGRTTIDFSNNQAVIALNKALLIRFYNVQHWSLPEGNLCPPIPGRADYIHYLADLLVETADLKNNQVPQGPRIKVLDIGTGASCIYPILGSQLYGWSFIGSDISPSSLASSKVIIDSNPPLKTKIKLREQTDSNHIFKGVIKSEDFFHLTLCNPPFHASAQEAQNGSARKWKNLGKKPHDDGSIKLNFGGQSNELWCPGGEVAFIKKMISESQLFGTQVAWFSSLVSKSGNLTQFKAQLKKINAKEIRVIEMSQGVKISRFLAWSFLSLEDRAERLKSQR